MNRWLHTIIISSALAVGLLLMAPESALPQVRLRTFGRIMVSDPPLWLYPNYIRSGTTTPPVWVLGAPREFKSNIPPNQWPPVDPFIQPPYWAPWRPPDFPTRPPLRMGRNWPMPVLPFYVGDLYGSVDRVRGLFSDIGGVFVEAASALPVDPISPDKK